MAKKDFKTIDNGFSYTFRLEMDLHQMQLMNQLHEGEVVSIEIKDNQVLFYNKSMLIGKAQAKDAEVILEFHHHFQQATIQSILENYGIMIRYVVSSLEPQLLSLKQLDAKKKDRRFLYHDANHYSTGRFLLYVITLIASLVVFVYAILLKESTMIIFLGIVLVSSLYLVIDQIKLYRRDILNKK